RFMVLPNQPFQLLPFRVIQVFSFSSSSGTMNVAHGSSLNNDFVLHPYIVSESRELFFHLILQVARHDPGLKSGCTLHGQVIY
ncbi:MAG: hypothetical protein WBM33_07535, partial [Limnochordia bacterium]